MLHTKKEGISILTPSWELWHNDSEEFDKKIQEILDIEDNLILDFWNTTFLNSVIVWVILWNNEKYSKQWKKIVISNVHDDIKEIFNLWNLLTRRTSMKVREMTVNNNRKRV